MAGKPIKYVNNYGADFQETPREEQLPKAPIIGDDPLNSFDRYHWKEQTDLGAWMTYAPEVREKKCKGYAANKANMDRRHKNLVYIIFIESAHKGGDSRVAAIAFRALFPEHAKTLMENAS
jgi:hypothetical protein